MNNRVFVAQFRTSLSVATLDSTATGISLKRFVVRIHALQPLLFLFDTGSSEMQDADFGDTLHLSRPLDGITSVSAAGMPIRSSLVRNTPSSNDELSLDPRRCPARGVETAIPNDAGSVDE